MEMMMEEVVEEVVVSS